MSTQALFAHAGALRDLYEEVDWAATGVGAEDGWSPALRTALRIVLDTNFPATLFWGPDSTMLYNRAYTDLIGAKHPAALGAPARQVFPEAWSTIGRLIDDILGGSEANWTENLLVPLERRGFLEDCWFTFSYSPVSDADGRVEGVLDIATETTGEVVTRRRLELLSRLRGVLAGLHLDAGPADLARETLTLLRGLPGDLPRVAVRGLGVDPTYDDPGLPRAPLPFPVGARSLFLQATPAGQVAWLPLAARGTDPAAAPPMLVVQLSPHLAADEVYLDFLRLVATTLAQALSRVAAREAEQRAVLTERALSHALQQSLLTAPIEAEQVQVAVGYRPAADHARVGGDWYDSFTCRDGAITFVIGDVAGHDREAAASMAQARNMLRGISYTLDRSPAPTLRAFDEAVIALDVDVFMTAVLARVVLPAAPGSPTTLRWSNAGHLPPVLLAADGTASLLTTEPEPMLGLDHDVERTDHELLLEPGASVVFYTDGLVERRGVHLDVGLDWLCAEVGGSAHLAAQELVDALMAEATNRPDDDIAVMVVRFSPA